MYINFSVPQEFTAPRLACLYISLFLNYPEDGGSKSPSKFAAYIALHTASSQKIYIFLK